MGHPRVCRRIVSRLIYIRCDEIFWLLSDEVVGVPTNAAQHVNRVDEKKGRCDRRGAAAAAVAPTRFSRDELDTFIQEELSNERAQLATAQNDMNALLQSLHQGCTDWLIFLYL